MPLIDTDDPINDLTADEGRLNAFMTDQGRAQLEKNEQPTFVQTTGAVFRSGNTLSGIFYERVMRVLNGHSFFYGDPINFRREWDPGEHLGNENFYQQHPYAVDGYGTLAGSVSEREFEFQMNLLKQRHIDQRTIELADQGTSAIALISVNGFEILLPILLFAIIIVRRKNKLKKNCADSVSDAPVIS
jgi:catalase